MLLFALTIGLVIFICFGVGIEITNRLNLKKQTYSAIIGLIVIMFSLQMLYYPVQYFNLSFNYIIFISTMILGSSLIISLKNIKKIIKELFVKETIYLLFTTIIFGVVLFNVFIDLAFSDAQMYLNYIAQNINIDELNTFNLYSGKTGAEWESIYLFQGYYHFGSYLCWLINTPYYLFGSTEYFANITISVYGLGMLYSIISSSFIISFINEIKVSNKIFKVVLIIFTLFYSNFYYWRVALSFYGNTYRTLLITFLIFSIYMWLTKGEKKYKYLLPLTIGAGIAFSSSFLFVSFAVIFALMVHMFIIKKENTFIDLSIIVSPMLLYAIVLFSKQGSILGLILLMLGLVYYLGLLFNYSKLIVVPVEKFVFDNSKKIFYIFVPLVLVIYSLYINVFEPEFLYNFNYWFQDHQLYDMVKDYRFVYANLLDNILNIIRWVAIILILFKEKKYDNSWIKTLFIVSLLLFLNPLTTTAVARLIASNVFYRILEVLFNPFTEAIMLVIIFDKYCDKKAIKTILYFILIMITILGHILSWVDNDNGLYTFHINGGKNVIPLYKVTWDEYSAIEEFNKITEYREDSIEVISHIEGLRTFRPDVYVMYTPRDYFYPYSRHNESFYQVAQNHYPWNEYETAPYERSCEFLLEYDIDYILIDHFHNKEYDVATDQCTTNLYQNELYSIKEVKK